jgi:hypothetical protein
MKCSIRDIGFVYENGVHTPTVLVEFPAGDFDARDRFVSYLRTLAKKPERRVVVGQESACTFVGGTKGAEVTFHVTTPAAEQGEGA